MPAESSSTMRATRSSDLLAPVLGPLGLRIDDHVGEEIVVAARLLEVVCQRLGALGAVLAEHLDPHALADERRREMIGRAAHEAVGLRGPGLQRLAALHHLAVVPRHLPGAVDAAIRAVGHERHQLDVLRLRLEIVERRRGFHRIAERRVLGDVGHELAVDIDRSAVLEGLDVLCAGLAGRHDRLRIAVRACAVVRQTSPSMPLISPAANPPTRWLGRPRLANAQMIAISFGSGASGSITVMPS